MESGHAMRGEAGQSLDPWALPPQRPSTATSWCQPLFLHLLLALPVPGPLFLFCFLSSTPCLLFLLSAAIVSLQISFCLSSPSTPPRVITS